MTTRMNGGDKDVASGLPLLARTVGGFARGRTQGWSDESPLNMLLQRKIMCDATDNF